MSGVIFMKWYQQKYVNHRDWILDSLEFLGLTSDEVIIVLLIDFLNCHGEQVSMETLSKKSGKTAEEVDQIISLLCAKNYLKIKASSRSVRFLLDGLFETETAKEEKILDSGLFEVFETTFGRTLSPKEYEKISEWNKSCDKKLIIYALREADTYGKLSFHYIDKVLMDWKARGITSQSIAKNV